MKRKSVRVAGAACLCLAAAACWGQELLPAVPAVNACHAQELGAADRLTLRQEACYYEQRLAGRGMLLHAFAVSGWAEFRNAPRVNDDGFGGFSERVGIFYAQRTARYAGELFASYLNHEDPRFHASREEGFWNRSRSALLSVVAIRDESGGLRPAYGPVAGAFGSGMTGAAYYSNHNAMDMGLRWSAITYGSYFASAMMHEFRPDLTLLAERLLHRKKAD